MAIAIKKISRLIFSSIADRTKQFEDIVLIIVLCLTSLIYTFILSQKHIHFQTFGWDTSVFDQQVYLASQLQTPYDSLNKIPGLGDHFHPLVLIVGGFLYKFWADPRVLFALQSIVASFSALPLYMLSKHLLSRTSLSKPYVRWLSIALCLLYLFSVPFQAMILDEFHDDALASFPIICIIYFLVIRNDRWYWISYMILLLTKEEYGLLSIPLGLYILLSTQNVKKAAVTAVLGLGTFYVLLFHLMPSLSGKLEYSHFFAQNRPSYVLETMLSNPIQFVSRFLDHPKKQETLKISLASFGFLPLLAPKELILPLSSLAVRFYDETTPRRFEYNNHYASPFIPLLAVSAVFSSFYFMQLSLRMKFLDPKRLGFYLLIYLLAATAFQDILFHGPINSLFKRSFYETQPWEYDARELIKHVPRDVIIASQNSLLPHLSQRSKYYLLPEIGDAEYIAVDLHDGPNKFAPTSREKLQLQIQDLLKKGSYEIIWEKDEAMLLKKK